jgi:hypothetical protein
VLCSQPSGRPSSLPRAQVLEAARGTGGVLSAAEMARAQRLQDEAATLHESNTLLRGENGRLRREAEEARARCAALQAEREPLLQRVGCAPLAPGGWRGSAAAPVPARSWRTLRPAPTPAARRPPRRSELEATAAAASRSLEERQQSLEALTRRYEALVLKHASVDVDEYNRVRAEVKELGARVEAQAAEAEQVRAAGGAAAGAAGVAWGAGGALCPGRQAGAWPALPLACTATHPPAPPAPACRSSSRSWRALRASWGPRAPGWPRWRRRTRRRRRRWRRCRRTRRWRRRRSRWALGWVDGWLDGWLDGWMGGWGEVLLCCSAPAGAAAACFLCPWLTRCSPHRHRLTPHPPARPQAKALSLHLRKAREELAKRGQELEAAQAAAQAAAAEAAAERDSLAQQLEAARQEAGARGEAAAAEGAKLATLRSQATKINNVGARRSCSGSSCLPGQRPACRPASAPAAAASAAPSASGQRSATNHAP